MQNYPHKKSSRKDEIKGSTIEIVDDSPFSRSSALRWNAD